MENWNGNKPGPNNFDNRYLGNMTVEFALENSRNAHAARICKEITPEVGYTFLKDKLNFTSLQPADNNIAPLAVGGMSEGVTVRALTAAFQIFANGGVFTEPYTCLLYTSRTCLLFRTHLSSLCGNVRPRTSFHSGTKCCPSTQGSCR